MENSNVISKKSTLIERAQLQVTGFDVMWHRLEQAITLGGHSPSTLSNYGRCIAKIALHFKMIPTALEEEQINGFLFDLKKGKNHSLSYFKHRYQAQNSKTHLTWHHTRPETNMSKMTARLRNY